MIENKQASERKEKHRLLEEKLLAATLRGDRWHRGEYPDSFVYCFSDFTVTYEVRMGRKQMGGASLALYASPNGIVKGIVDAWDMASMKLYWAVAQRNRFEIDAVIQQAADAL